MQLYGVNIDNYQLDSISGIAVVHEYDDIIDVEPLEYDHYVKKLDVTIASDGITEITLTIPRIPIGQVILNSVVQKQGVDYEFVQGDGTVTLNWISTDFILETDDDLEVYMV